MGAKKITDENKVSEPNIKGLEALINEFKNDKIEPRRLIALRLKLVSLLHEKKITEDEQAFMENILKRDRKRGQISTIDDYLLNTIENDRCTDKAIVKVDNAPQTHHLQTKGLECRYVKDYENDKYIVFVPRTVPTEHQIPPEIAYKRLNNFPVSMEELPKPRVLIHRLILSGREFKAWFEVVEDEIDFSKAASEVAEEYKF